LIGSRRASVELRHVTILVAALLATLLAFSSRAEAFVYWTNFAGDSIARANLDGSGANQAFLSAINPCGVAVDGAHIYWANQSGSAPLGTIARANLDGSGVNQSFITGANNPCGVAVNESHIYWGNRGVGGTTIGRANLDGSGANQNFITGLNRPNDVAVNATHIFWAEPLDSTIGRANLVGGGVNQTFVNVLGTPDGVAVNSTHIFWADTNGPIGRANLDGTSPDSFGFINDGGDNPSGIAVDASHLYWSNKFGDTIGRANVDGTGVNQAFIAGANEPTGVAVDGLGFPACDDVTASTGANQSVAIALPCSGGSLVHAISSGPANGQISTFDAPAGTLTYTPNPEFAGTDSFTYVASNPVGVSNTATATVTVVPSNDFDFGKAKKNKKKGTAKLEVKVPGPGQLELDETKKVKGADKRAEGRGTVKLPVKPRGNAKEKLADKGKAKVKAEVTFTPDGGVPNTKTTTVGLAKK
jgi:Bacterial Ig domain